MLAQPRSGGRGLDWTVGLGHPKSKVEGQARGRCKDQSCLHVSDINGSRLPQPQSCAIYNRHKLRELKQFPSLTLAELHVSNRSIPLDWTSSIFHHPFHSTWLGIFIRLSNTVTHHGDGKVTEARLNPINFVSSTVSSTVYVLCFLCSMNRQHDDISDHFSLIQVVWSINQSHDGTYIRTPVVMTPCRGTRAVQQTGCGLPVILNGFGTPCHQSAGAPYEKYSTSLLCRTWCPRASGSSQRPAYDQRSIGYSYA